MRTLHIRVIPNARQNRILEEGDRFRLYLTAPAIDGRANKALIAYLADHFGVSKSAVKIIKGEKSRDKVVQIAP